MNYSVTKELLDVVASFVPESKIRVNTKNTDWTGKVYISDLVTIDAENGVGFEVLDHEIIMFYFSEHHHFEDYSCERDENEPNYVERAKAFLLDLFSCTITHQKRYRGKTLISEQYIFTHPDGTEDCLAGTWVHGILIRLVPFLKNRTERQSWYFDREKGAFSEHPPRKPDPDVVEVIDISEDCYIEITQSHNVYSYGIMEMDFDEYSGYFWAPAVDGVSSGLYDTKEKAIRAAMEALKCREQLH